MRLLILIFLLSQITHASEIKVPGKENWGRPNRTYSLTAKSEITKDGPVQVTSSCQLINGKAEGIYSNCVHTIRFVSGHKTLTLKGGDLVFLSNVPGVIGTLTFGCCSAPNTAAFYTTEGRLLGYLQSDRESSEDDTRGDGMRDFGNYAVPSGFFLISERNPSGGEPKNHQDYAVYFPDLKEKEPLELNVKIPKQCGTWGDAVHFREKDSAFELTFGLSECDKRGDYRGHCSHGPGKWHCEVKF